MWYRVKRNFLCLLSRDFLFRMSSNFSGISILFFLSVGNASQANFISTLQYHETKSRTRLGDRTTTRAKHMRPLLHTLCCLPSWTPQRPPKPCRLHHTTLPSCLINHSSPHLHRLCCALPGPLLSTHSRQLLPQVFIASGFSHR